MTCANKLMFLAMMLSVLVSTKMIFALERTQEILSNDMYSCAGNGDTLWILSSKGINVTTRLTADTVSWTGFEGVSASSLVFGASTVFALPLQAGANKIWMANNSNSQPRTVLLPFRKETFSFENLDKEPFTFYAVSASTMSSTGSWLACGDGGIVPLSIRDGSVSASFQVGMPKPLTFDEYVFSRIKTMPDSTPDLSRRALSLAWNQGRLWVACEKALWYFTPQDSSWTRIADSILQIQRYFAVTLSYENDSTFIYALLATRPGVTSDTQPHLYRYDIGHKQWNRCIEKVVYAVAPASRNRFFVLDNQNRLELFQDTTPPVVGLPHAPYLRSPLIDDAAFGRRIKDANGSVVGYSIRGIHYSVSASDTILAIATDRGLFYSRHEFSDAASSIPFRFAGRNIFIAAGLKKTYPIPGIINQEHVEAVFAYNLSEPDYVTIDIFDFNMDRVLRVVDQAYRLPGSAMSSGRSTVPVEDRWNGTKDNRNGRVVAPGVYYYRITTRKGLHAFGKVVVAR